MSRKSEIEKEKRKINKEKIEDVIAIYKKLKGKTVAYFGKKPLFKAEHSDLLTEIEGPLTAGTFDLDALIAVVSVKAPVLYEVSTFLKKDLKVFFEKAFSLKKIRDFAEWLISIKEQLSKAIDGLEDKEETERFHF